jgi:hypothetical protein
VKRFSVLVASILLLACINVTYGQDYQKVADATAWKFSPEQASVTDSFLKFSRDYQVELIRPKNKFGEIIIRIVDDGKELCSWEGHYRSVFTLSGDVLVYAEFFPSRTGCTVVAYDLKKQKQLWKTPLKGLGDIAHFRYSNAVNLEIVNSEAVRVFGKESAGQYVEFVDLKTSKTVGHRVYGK